MVTTAAERGNPVRVSCECHVSAFWSFKSHRFRVALVLCYGVLAICFMRTNLTMAMVSFPSENIGCFSSAATRLGRLRVSIKTDARWSVSYTVYADAAAKPLHDSYNFDLRL